MGLRAGIVGAASSSRDDVRKLRVAGRLDGMRLIARADCTRILDAIVIDVQVLCQIN